MESAALTNSYIKITPTRTIKQQTLNVKTLKALLPNQNEASYFEVEETDRRGATPCGRGLFVVLGMIIRV